MLYTEGGAYIALHNPIKAPINRALGKATFAVSTIGKWVASIDAEWSSERAH